jgi:hypothetical protein
MVTIMKATTTNTNVLLPVCIQSINPGTKSIIKNRKENNMRYCNMKSRNKMLTFGKNYMRL